MATTGSAGDGLSGHVASGVRWGLFNQLVQQLTRLSAQFVLTRLLAPRAFGAMAIALILINLGTLLSGVGFAQALIQRPTVTKAQIDAALGGSLVLGLALAALSMVVAEPVAAFFDTPQAAPMLRVLSLVFVCQSVEGVPNSMLRRSLLFRPFVLSSTAGAVAGAAFGVALALAGAGVWSLVGFAVLEAVVATTLGWLFAMQAGVWRPAISFDLRPLQELLSYSTAVTSTRLLVFVIRNIDNVIVGRVLGVTALGFYGLAYRVMLLPIQRLSDILANVTLPAFARMHDDPARLGDAFLRSARALAAVLVPIVVGCAVTAPVLVPVVFGARWEPAADPLRILCLSGPALATGRLNGNLFEAIGRAGWTVALSAMALVILLPAFLVGVEHGITGVAWAYTISAYVGLIPALLLVERGAGISWRRQLGNLRWVAAATAGLVVGATAAGALVDPLSAAKGELLAMTAGGAGCYLAILWALDRELVRDVVGILTRRSPITRELP